MSTTLKMQYIPLSSLHVSKLNMRHGNKTPDIENILPSIETTGLHTPLIVRKEQNENEESSQDTYGVIAGRRRLFCLYAIEEKSLNDNGEEFDSSVPCIIVDNASDAEGIEISLIENTARHDATAMEECRSFLKLHKEGQDIANIAHTFGITELTVKKRLALGNLIPKLQELFESGEIEGRDIETLTMATKVQQRDYLKLYKDGNAPRYNSLKAWITGGDLILTCAALFDLESYKGKIITDLFGEHGQFANREHFLKAQGIAIAQRIAVYEADDWEVIQLDGYFDSYSHVKLPKEKGGKIYIETRRDQSVKFHEGFITDKAHKAMMKKVAAQTDNGANTIKAEAKPELSGPLSEYVDLHRHSIIRAELLKRPEIILRLTTAHMIRGRRNYEIKAEDRRASKDATEQSANASKSELILSTERKEIIALLEYKGVNEIFGSYTNGITFSKVFTRLLELNDIEVLRIQNFVMLEALTKGCEVIETLGAMMEVKFEDHWTPDDAFFDALRDKDLICKIIKEIGTKTAAAEAIGRTAKQQKTLLLARLNGENGHTAISKWTPKFMQFPPSSYRKANDCKTTRQWAFAKKLFSKAIKQSKS